MGCSVNFFNYQGNFTAEFYPSSIDRFYQTWDQETYFSGSGVGTEQSYTTTGYIPVVGPGTSYPVSCKVDASSIMVWRAKRIDAKITIYKGGNNPIIDEEVDDQPVQPPQLTIEAGKVLYQGVGFKHGNTILGDLGAEIRAYLFNLDIGTRIAKLINIKEGENGDKNRQKIFELYPRIHFSIEEGLGQLAVSHSTYKYDVNDPTYGGIWFLQSDLSVRIDGLPGGSINLPLYRKYATSIDEDDVEHFDIYKIEGSIVFTVGRYWPFSKQNKNGDFYNELNGTIVV